MTTLLLVRHGESTLSAADRFAGSTDAPLSDEGRRQATRLGDRLAHAPIRAIYASPLGRTMDTARCIGDRHGLVPSPESALREIDHGRWETLSHAEAEHAFPDDYAAWKKDPFLFGPALGETGLDVVARALPVVRDIARRHDDECVVIVSHKATLRLVVVSLLGLDPRGYREHLDLLPASLSAVELTRDAQAKLVLYNDISHYGSFLP